MPNGRPRWRALSQSSLVDLEEDPADLEAHEQPDTSPHNREQRGTQPDEPPDAPTAAQDKPCKVFLSSGPTARLIPKRCCANGRRGAGRGGLRAKAARTAQAVCLPDNVWGSKRNLPTTPELEKLKGGNWSCELGFQDTSGTGIVK